MRASPLLLLIFVPASAHLLACLESNPQPSPTTTAVDAVCEADTAGGAADDVAFADVEADAADWETTADAAGDTPPPEDATADLPEDAAADLPEDASADLPGDEPCDEDIIGFTPENEPKYEFYELCVAADAGDQEAALQAVDPSIYCGVGGVFAECGPGETACHGDLHFADPATKEIGEEMWSTLCQLTATGVVVKIVGGHWL